MERGKVFPWISARLDQGSNLPYFLLFLVICLTNLEMVLPFGFAGTVVEIVHMFNSRSYSHPKPPLRSAF